MKKVLIINGHPDKESYNTGLANSYYKGLKTTNSIIDRIDLFDLNFDPNLKFGYRKRCDLEPDLQDSIAKIKEADHLVWVFPMWWYSIPAQLKGFIDRTFLPGIAFESVEGKSLPKKLFIDKTARLIITSDTPRWYDYLFMKSPAINQFKKGTLEFCGVKPVKVTYIAPIKNSTVVFREKWLEKVYQLGVKMK